LLPNTVLFASQPPGANQVAWHCMTRGLATATRQPFPRPAWRPPRT